MRHLRHVLLYAILVGLPGLGLFAILRVGDSIEPPPMLAGAWALESAGGACLPSDTLTIAQSGRYLQVEPRRIDAAVDGAGTVHARWAIEAGACRGRSARWRAQLAEGRLTGPLAVDGCERCNGRLEAAPTE